MAVLPRPFRRDTPEFQRRKSEHIISPGCTQGRLPELSGRIAVSARIASSQDRSFAAWNATAGCSLVRPAFTTNTSTIRSTVSPNGPEHFSDQSPSRLLDLSYISVGQLAEVHAQTACWASVPDHLSPSCIQTVCTQIFQLCTAAARGICLWRNNWS